MAYLSWISDKDLQNAVSHFVASVKQGERQAEAKFTRNVIDPFSAAFSMILFDLKAEEWKKGEINRQIDKALSNAIGVFHQQILSSIKGWKDLNNTNQVDLVNDDRKIIAELKNKHNTLNAAGTVTLYKKLSELVNSKSSIYKGYTSYYVMIIPKSAAGVDDLFYPSDNALGERCKQDEKIRMIDGRRFYALASGSETALDDLFGVIPAILSDMGTIKLATADQSFIQSIFEKAYKN